MMQGRKEKKKAKEEQDSAAVNFKNMVKKRGKYNFFIPVMEPALLP